MAGISHAKLEPGKGTTFKVYFPAAKPLDGFSNGEVARLTVTGGTETILLVDDEDFILELGQQILQQSGYKVLTARTGKEALQIYRAATRRYIVGAVGLDHAGDERQAVHIGTS